MSLIIDFLLGLGILFFLIVFHECGHYIMAKRHGWEPRFTINRSGRMYNPLVRSIKKNVEIHNGQDLRRALLEHVAISQGGFLGLLSPLIGMTLFPSLVYACIFLVILFTAYSIYESSTMCIKNAGLEKIVVLEIRKDDGGEP